MSQKEWTIMIYMAGDNNLAVDMAYAMEQIKAVAGDGPESPNLFVYYDGNSPSIPTLYCDFSDPNSPKYARSFKVENKLYDVTDKKNENAADRRSVLNFVDWCVNKVEVTDANGNVTYGRRGNKYALIFSGHSLGFQDNGLFKDESTGKTMKMKDLYFLLERMTNPQKLLDDSARDRELYGEFLASETQLLLGQKLDILGFDACVMGMLEVGYQFSQVAKTMIASEGSVPSAGWTYAKILGCMARGGDDCGQVAEHFVRQFIESQDSFTVGGVSVDMAAWDLSHFHKLTEAVDYLAACLLDCFHDPNERIYKQMERVILQVHWKCQSYMYDQNVDLGDFCELLDMECASLIDELDGADDTLILDDIRAACKSVQEGLEKAVILSGFSGGDYQYSNGISLFFPWSREGYDVSKKHYEGLWFVKDLGRKRKFTWTGFLRKYLNEVALRPFREPEKEVAVGSKYRYYSGLPIEEDSLIAAFSMEDAKLAGEKDSKLAGEKDSKLAGEKDSKLAGEKDSKLAGEKDSKLAGEKDSKLAGEKDSKLAGEKDSKLAGEKDWKLAGEKDSKLAGEKDSKLAGEKDSKLAGEKDSKLAGEKDSKLAGEKDSKLGGGSGSDAFFDHLRSFKNIETRWNISGLSKKAADYPSETDRLRAKFIPGS